jgi:2-polyprenyl-6-methoxyphenol hydroxylase-like FAD-dependent oxidoreductase
MPLPTVLVAGAGPTGLAAALFLTLRGLPVRLIERAEAPRSTSRALVVNPRSLELLESTAVTARMLAAGRPLLRVRFYQQWRPLAQIEFGRAHPRYAMLVLSQARSEQFLAEALAELGVIAERGTELVGLEQRASGVGVELLLAGAARELVSSDLVFGADGAHSRVRESLGLGFEGSSFPEPWTLRDLELDTPLDLESAHVSFSPEGFTFLLALQPQLWRALGNVPQLLAQLPPGSEPGEIRWDSSFHIAHRVAGAAACGRVALGGDAAHVHSPIGARGMNLGIEDAYVFASRVHDSIEAGPPALEAYGRTRHAVHRQVVRRVQLLTSIGRGRPAPMRVIRRVLFPLAAGWPPTASLMERAVSGLDHEVRTM